MNGSQRTVRRVKGLSLAALWCLAVSALVGCATAPAVSRTAQKDKPVVTRVARHVDPGDFQRHVDMLASDTLTGRGVGTPGIEMAAAYLAGQFASFGIEPGGTGGTYFQDFDMSIGSELTDDYAFNFSGVDVSPVRGEDFIPFFFSSNDTFEGDVVFAGYGIVNEDKAYDDYKDLDVEGKVVLMLRREPPSWSDGGGTTHHAMFRNKVYTARDHGAAAVLIVNRVTDRPEDRLMRFGERGGRGNFGLPAFHIKQSLADRILQAGGLESLEAMQTNLDEGQFASAPLHGVRLAGKAGIVSQMANVRNVIGVIRGEGPLADEYVVIGGHYDHLGNSVSEMPSFGRRRGPSGEPEIHNGADDNASGTAGVIECGRALMQMRPLKRSVLLIAFTGEESGLYGSKHFVDNATVPLENIVAMLNMDMIGRLKDDETVQVFGTKAADEFEPMMERLCAQCGLKLKSAASAIGPSDHTSFYQKQIPSMHFFSGLHADYHRPSDDADKINADGGARITDLVLATACEIIESDARPTYHEVKERAQIGRATGRGGVVMGVMPSYFDADQATGGMEIDGVSPGGPAEQAGMKAGDRIVKIGQTDVANVYDYMGALRNNKPGDVIDVVIARGDERLTLKVTLASRQ